VTGTYKGALIDMKNIVLIGMPSAGKSTLGVLLAKSLCMPFTDTDLIIQEKENMLLQDIINNFGIDHFLEVEEKVILDCNFTNHIVATGGSVVYSELAMEHLKKNGIVIYLKLDYKEIEQRLNNIKTRGVAITAGQTLKDLYDIRTPLYEKYADITVDCSNKDMEASVEEIISMLK
jgi:shikimate kinase